ncbi:MAG: hypothetical protein ACYCS1_07970 [Gammaproteobacteria bacterium]
MSTNRPELADSIQARLQAYAHRLAPHSTVTDIAIRNMVRPALDASFTALLQALAEPMSHDFLRYRLATYFHAREEDFKNPLLSRQTLLPAPLGRDPHPTQAASGHADI